MGLVNWLVIMPRCCIDTFDGRRTLLGLYIAATWVELLDSIHAFDATFMSANQGFFLHSSSKAQPSISPLEQNSIPPVNTKKCSNEIYHNGQMRSQLPFQIIELVLCLQKGYRLGLYLRKPASFAENIRNLSKTHQVVHIFIGICGSFCSRYNSCDNFLGTCAVGRPRMKHFQINCHAKVNLNWWPPGWKEGCN